MGRLEDNLKISFYLQEGTGRSLHEEFATSSIAVLRICVLMHNN